jgi:hypothetical protein
MRKYTLKNKKNSGWLLRLRIAGVDSKIFIAREYGPDFLKTLKTRYRYFLVKTSLARKVYVYNGLLNKYAFENFVRRAYSSLLLKNNGFLLHASGVICRGKGYIFTGVSGAGKTTAAEASKKYGVVVSDEIIALRKTGGCWTLFGTPFMGLMKGGGKNKAAVRPRLFFLKQAPKNALKPVLPEKAWPRLLRNVVLFKPGKKIAGLTYSFLCASESRVLFFKKTGFWRTLWSAK